MKKVIFASLLSLIVVTLSGCSTSNKTVQDIVAPPTQTKVSVENSDQTTYEATERIAITDPALSNYLSDKDKTADKENLPSLSADEIKKIGLIARITGGSKYELAGTAQIVSESLITLKNFSFNGACLPMLIYLTRSSQTENPLLKVKEISAPVSNVSINLEIPQNTSLTTFDSISFYCADKPQTPVSTVSFQY